MTLEAWDKIKTVSFCFTRMKKKPAMASSVIVADTEIKAIHIEISAEAFSLGESMQR